MLRPSVALAPLLFAILAGVPLIAQTPAPVEEQPKKQEAPVKSDDPFADLEAQLKPEEPTSARGRSFFKDNFGFRMEIMSQFDTNENAQAASRQSAGFEVLKKFSSATSTIASFNFQGRFVRRDGFNPVMNDMEGAGRPGWAFEYHNLYVDLYNVFNPLLSEDQRRRKLGRFNFRIGRFYVPFGLNLQTDTHGTVLQLSNERNFGFERDWYAGFWGILSKHLKYDVYYLTGSGYDLKYKGQSGLGAIRISLANRFSADHGIEGGFSVIAGERISSPMGRSNAGLLPLATERVGIDGRIRRAVPTGLVTVTTEMSGGRDAKDAVFNELHQAEYLHSSRRWGIATQFRRFTQERFAEDASLATGFTWYFRNDAGNSNLHWISFNVERRIHRAEGIPRTIVTLQYYFYR